MSKKNFNVPQHKNLTDQIKPSVTSLKQKVQQYNQQVKQKQQQQEQKNSSINIPVPRTRLQQKKFIVYSDEYDKDSLILKILFQRPWWRFSPNVADANLILVANTPKIGLFNQRASERCIINSLPRSEVILDYISMYQSVTNAMGNTAYQFLNVSYNITHNSSKFLNHFKYLESFILGTNNKFQYNPRLHDQLLEQNNAYEQQLAQQQLQLQLEKKRGPANSWNKLLYSNIPSSSQSKVNVKEADNIQGYRQEIQKQRKITNSARFKAIQYDYRRRQKNSENNIIDEITSPVRRMQLQEEQNELLWGQLSQLINQNIDQEETDQENTGIYSQDEWQLAEQNNNSKIYQVNQSQINDSFQEIQNYQNQVTSSSRAASQTNTGQLQNQSIVMSIDDLQQNNPFTPQHNRARSGPNAYKTRGIMQTPDMMKTPRQYLDEQSIARRYGGFGSVSILYHSRHEQNNLLSSKRMSVQSRPQSVNYKGRTIVCQQPWQSRTQSRVQSVNYYSKDYSTRGSIRRDVRVQSANPTKRVNLTQEITPEQMDLLLTSSNVNKHEPVKHSQKSTLKFNQNSAVNPHKFDNSEKNQAKAKGNQVKLPFEYDYTPPVFNKLNIWRIIQNNKTLIQMTKFKDIEKINTAKGVTVAQKSVEWQLQYRGRNITVHFYTLVKQNGDIYIYKCPLARLQIAEAQDEINDDAETGCTKNKDINYLKISQLNQAALERCQITDYTKKLYIQIKYIIGKILYYTSRERLGRGAPSKNSFLLLEFQFKITSEGHPMFYCVKNATNMPYGNAPCFDFFSKLIDDMFDLTIDRVFVDVETYIKEYQSNENIQEYDSQIERKRRQLKGQSSSYSEVDYNKYDTIDILAEIPEKERELEHLRFSKCGRKENLFDQIARKWLFT